MLGRSQQKDKISPLWKSPSARPSELGEAVTQAQGNSGVVLSHTDGVNLDIDSSRRIMSYKPASHVPTQSSVEMAWREGPHNSVALLLALDAQAQRPNVSGSCSEVCAPLFCARLRRINDFIVTFPGGSGDGRMR